MPLRLLLSTICSLTILAGYASPLAAKESSSALGYEAEVAAAIKQIDKTAQAGPYQPNWPSLEKYEIPQWYKDAKFGIFIHWGVYSVPAYGGEWYPRWMYTTEGHNKHYHQHHVKTFGPVSKFGYKDFIPQFTAAKFEPASWAKLFKDSGARYVMPVAEHHDGFPMYDCAFTDWSAKKMGPQRDLIAELRTAIKDEGLKFGVSSHRAFNWSFFPRLEGADNTKSENFGLYSADKPFLHGIKGHGDYPAPDQEFKDQWLARSCELVDKYDPDLIWFDFGIGTKWVESYDNNPYEDYIQRFTAYYYNLAEQRGKPPIVNYKFNAYPEQAAVLDIERSKMDAIRTPFWQTDTAVSKTSWGYTKDHKYKEVNILVDDLIDIVSKNGCLLLNIGPKPDGTIPEHEQKMLRQIGGWLKLNGEAIYSARAWKTFGEGPTKVVTGHVSEGKNKTFTANDIRITVKRNVLYAMPLAWPAARSLTVRCLKNTADGLDKPIQSIELLGSEAKIEWMHTAEGLTVQLPEKAPCDYAVVLKITVKGELQHVN